MRHTGLFRIVFAALCLMKLSGASHFQGGTINWKVTDVPSNKVQFYFKMGWTLGMGPGCSSSADYGKLKTHLSNQYWQCLAGCGAAASNMADVNYYCTNVNNVDRYEQGDKAFNYTFPNKGPFEVVYTGGAWRQLDYGYGGSWSLVTTVNLQVRSDNGLPNQSPITASKPIYKQQYECNHTIHLPVTDPDGDTVKCRWAVGAECQSVCRALPNAKLDQDTCTVTFDAQAGQSYKPGGWYAVAIQVEDFPKTTINIGGTTYTPNDPINSVPLQFLLTTPRQPYPCTAKPVFVADTPADGERYSIRPGATFTLKLYAWNQHYTDAFIREYFLVAPAGMKTSGVVADDKGRRRVGMETLTWTPTPLQAGENVLCFEAEDTKGLKTEMRCVTLIGHDIDECASNPCGPWCKCTDFTGRYECNCPPTCPPLPDACYPRPCLNGGTCTLDAVAASGFTCSCTTAWTGTTCQFPVNECASNPCANGGTCTDHIGEFICECAAGYTGKTCAIDIDDCADGPCHNGGTCVDGVNSHTCMCAAGWTGNHCQTKIPKTTTSTSSGTTASFTILGPIKFADIDECASSPCAATCACIDGVNGYICLCLPTTTATPPCPAPPNACFSRPCWNNGTCSLTGSTIGYGCTCAPGWTGPTCEVNIDECAGSPCENNGTCTDLVNQYVCSCPAGWKGTHCETNIDDCADTPCHNGGTCQDKVNGHSCLCPPLFYGVHCEFENTTEVTSAAPVTYDHCICKSPERIFAGDSDKQSERSVILPGLLGMLVGMALLGSGFGLWYYFRKQRPNRATVYQKQVRPYTPPDKPAIEMEETPPPTPDSQTKSITPRKPSMATNIYRVTNDDLTYQAAPSKNPNSYASGRPDWEEQFYL